MHVEFVKYNKSNEFLLEGQYTPGALLVDKTKFEKFLLQESDSIILRINRDFQFSPTLDSNCFHPRYYSFNLGEIFLKDYFTIIIIEDLGIPYYREKYERTEIDLFFLHIKCSSGQRVDFLPVKDEQF